MNSMLSAAVVPSFRGETEFADLRAGRWHDFGERRELRRATTEEVVMSPEARAA